MPLYINVGIKTIKTVWRNDLSKESGVFYVKGMVTEMTFTVTVMTIEFCFPQLFFVTMTYHW